MQAFLKKHGQDFPRHSLKVEWSRTDRLITGVFFVQKRYKEEWSFADQFSSDFSKNWGLWNHDVVEGFFQLRQHQADVKAPYLEWQVSPKNQPFALVITEPRQHYFSPQQLSFKHEVELADKTWITRFEVELPPELKGHQLYGGFFSCLEQNPREFYALNPNSEDKPDFHRPELFLPLDES